MLKVLDLFSGIGGFSLGLERTGGFRTAAFCEIDPFCRRVLAKHWPEVPCHDDVRSFVFHQGSAHVICGGFPCQDLSQAGAGAGLSGSRSGLYREMVRAIRVVRPLYAIMENVAALLNRGMGEVLGCLAEIGYDAEWDCIPASVVGAPHSRDRLWIVAYPFGTRFQGWLIASRARQTQRELAGRTFRAGPSWPDAPSVPRVGYGLPDWVDRIRSIGNAVVPQIPEIIGRAILAAESERAAA